MTLPPATARNLRPRRNDRRRGFSFVELLFAVMILGIGFIMVAAIFPAALSQTRTTQEETTSATLARAAAGYVEAVPYASTMMAADGRVHAFAEDTNSILWKQIRGAQVLADDPRFAFVPFYRRRDFGAANPTSLSAQLFVIAVQARNQSAYDVIPGSGPTEAALAPKLVEVQLEDHSTSVTAPDLITFRAASGGPSNGPSAVASGTFVIISYDPTPGPSVPPEPPSIPGYCNGYVYRVGANVSGDQWELQPGNDLHGNAPHRPLMPTGTLAYIVGRSVDPQNTSIYSGGAQDISVYSTFVPFK